MTSKRKDRAKKFKEVRKLGTLMQKTALKTGDTVMIIAGGNKLKRENKGKVGKIKAFAGKKKDRAIIEGLNYHSKHRKQLSTDKPAGKIPVEGSIHISNLMLYVDKIKKPVRVKFKFLDDGKKVRGYLDPESKSFVQV